MAKLFLIFVVTGLIFLGCNNNDKKPENIIDKNGIPLIELAKFEIEAGKYVDKKIKVVGIADHVCKHGGKRLFLVSDEADLHVDSDKRFDDKYVGKEVIVTGIVRELRIDESYCMKMEEDNIQSHKSGDSDKDFYERKKEMIQSYRDSMKAGNIDHLSFYSLDYISLEEKK